uniref:Murine retrovirus integration site 1 homolog n=1 Tax=Varanus komodoensis TaxID=61221 RepID=A0A8D2LJ23_VARKO
FWPPNEKEGLPGEEPNAGNNRWQKEKGTKLAVRLKVSTPLLYMHDNVVQLVILILCCLDNAGHVIDLVNDQLPDVKISEEDKKKNLELLEEAKRVSERFLTRRGRKSRSSLSDSPTAPSPVLSPSISPVPSRNNSFTLPSPTGKIYAACSNMNLYLVEHLWKEHILMRNQHLVGLKLPDLSEAAEQEREEEEEDKVEEEAAKTRRDVMPNIPDTLLRKLRVHTSLPGSMIELVFFPPLQNVFVQLSLAFRNDSYTLESRINQAERERNLSEENTEKELDNFKVAITTSASLWHHSEHRDMYQKLLEDIAVLHRLASRLSSRAEMVGAVRQEKRMSKATEVMMQYVENLKRTYEKDHAELMEYKKLANQNSSRSYGSPGKTVYLSKILSMSISLHICN